MEPEQARAGGTVQNGPRLLSASCFTGETMGASFKGPAYPKPGRVLPVYGVRIRPRAQC